MLDLYDLAVNLIGQVPTNLYWLYPLTTLVLLGIVIFGISFPFIAMYMIVKN